MKKVLSLLLAMTLVLSLAACNEKDKDGDKPDVSGNPDISSIGDVSDPGLEGDSSESYGQEVEDDSGVETPGGDATVLPMTPVVFVDNDNYTWKVVGIDESPYDDFSLSVYVENKTADKSLMFTTQGFTVNGVFDTDGFSWQLEPGESDTVKWGFHNYTHADVNLGEYTEIAGIWLVGEKDTWVGDPIETGEFRICPFGEEDVVLYNRLATDSDEVLVDNENVSVTLVDYMTDVDDGDFQALLYIENKAGKPITLSVENEKVNGEDVMALFIHTIKYGDRSFAYLTWEKEKLDDAGISGVIETIDFTLEVRDANEFTSLFAEEPISLGPAYTWGS